MPKPKQKLRGSPSPIPGRCGAKLRKSNPPRYCTVHPMENGHCRIHGGASPKPGPGHPNWQHGRYSEFTRHLPERMRKGFEASMSDPDLLSVRGELALIDSRLHDLLDRLTTGESADRMRLLSEAIHQIGSALAVKTPDVKTLRALAQRARGLLDLSFGEDSVWGQIHDTLGARIRLTESERKLAEMKQSNIAADRLQVLLTQLLSSVRQHVVDLPGGAEAVNGVARDLFNMMGLGASAPGGEERMN